MIKNNLIIGTSNPTIHIPTEHEFQQIVRAESELKIQQLPEYLSIARDYFVIGCSTSLRFSDIASLTPADIKIVSGQECIVIYLKKTNGSAEVIPLNSVSKFFINKQFKSNNYKGIKQMSIFKINEHLHSLFSLLGFNTYLPVIRGNGINITSILIPKWQVLSMHSSRMYFHSLWLINNPRTSRSSTKTGSQHNVHKGFQKMQKVFEKVELPPTIASIRKAKLTKIENGIKSQDA